MTKKFTLEKVLYFTQKDEQRGFHVGLRDAPGTGTDLSGIITNAKGNGFIFEKSKDKNGAHYGITDKGRVRLLFAKMLFNVSRDYPLDDLTKDVMAMIPPVLEQNNLTYPQFHEAITSAMQGELNSKENKDMMRLLNQFNIVTPTRSQSKYRRLRAEFKDFGKIIASYGPEMKESIGNKAKGLFKRLVGGSDDTPKETLAFEDEKPAQVESKKPSNEKAASADKSTEPKGASKPAASESPMDEAKVLKTLHAMFKERPVYDDFHDDEFKVPDGVSIQNLVDAGFAKVAAEDDAATYYELTPKGNNFAMRVETQLLKSAGLPLDQVKPMLTPKEDDKGEVKALSYNGKVADAPTAFDPNMSFSDYIKRGNELMRAVLPESAANMVNDLHWDGAHDEQLSLYDAVKDLVDNADVLVERANKAQLVQPEKLRETAMKLQREFLGNLTPEQLKGALFMEVFKTTGQKISKHQMDIAVDGPAPEQPAVEPMRRRA